MNENQDNSTEQDDGSSIATSCATSWRGLGIIIILACFGFTMYCLHEARWDLANISEWFALQMVFILILGIILSTIFFIKAKESDAIAEAIRLAAQAADESKNAVDMIALLSDAILKDNCDKDTDAND